MPLSPTTKTVDPAPASASDQRRDERVELSRAANEGWSGIAAVRAGRGQRWRPAGGQSASPRISYAERDRLDG